MEREEQIRLALLELFPQAEACTSPSTETPALESASSEKSEAPRQAGVLKADYGQSGVCLDVLCLPDQLLNIAKILDEQGLFLETISGVDWPEQEQIELLYDFNQMASPSCRILVRTFLQRNTPVVPSISSIFPGADWHERETYDFFGVQFTGHPYLVRILLPEDADFYPLLKDYMP